MDAAKNPMQRLRSFNKCIRALSPIPYLAKAWDYSVRSMSGCVGLVEYADYAGFVAAHSVAMPVPISHSFNSSSLGDHDSSYRELIRAASQRERATTPRAKLSDHQPFPRSYSTPLGYRSLEVERIEEDSPCYFSESFHKTHFDEDIRFQRSRSCSSSVKNLNLHGKRNINAV